MTPAAAEGGTVRRPCRAGSGEATDVDVLVTGASGFIGQALLGALARRGDVRAIGVTRADVDLADSALVRSAVVASRPRKLVHLAAALPTGESAGEADRQWRDTFLAGRNVLRAAVDAGVEHVLMAGSLAELGAASGLLPAHLPPRPVTDYGRCKARLLEVAASVARGGRMRIDWFRPFTVYGPGQTGPMLVPSAFSAAIAGRPADFTDGSQERDFLFVDDLVAWLVAGLSWPVPQDSSGGLVVHHLGTGRGTAVRHVLERIAEMFPQASFRLGALPRRPGEPSRQVALPSDGSWAWAARTALPEGLAATASWWRARGQLTHRSKAVIR